MTLFDKICIIILEILFPILSCHFQNKNKNEANEKVSLFESEISLKNKN